jgi:pimeloyl-ACP methyl ester carboxylesterase
METLRLLANGIEIFALADGPRDGPLALLLHGFPQLSRSWRHQLLALAGAGWRAVAPDLRGYGESSREGPYDVWTLAGDARATVRALGRERGVIVGHDWGGAVAWATAARYPEVVERLVVLNCPHPRVLKEELLRNPRQLLRSWYMLSFQLPWLPERVLAWRRAAPIAWALRAGSSVRGAFPPSELEAYRDAYARPGAVAGALGIYRAMLRGPGAPRDELRPIAAPTLCLWGARDRFLGRETIDPVKMKRWFAPGNAPTVRFVEKAGHFVLDEAPARVNAELLAWLGAPVKPRSGC